MVHFDEFYVSVYFAAFPSEYLINILKNREEKLNLIIRDLFNTDDRTEFIKEFVALLRFVAAGEVNIGHLRKDSRVIHRSLDEPVGMLHPPEEIMDESEETN